MIIMMRRRRRRRRKRIGFIERRSLKLSRPWTMQGGNLFYPPITSDILATIMVEGNIGRKLCFDAKVMNLRIKTKFQSALSGLENMVDSLLGWKLGGKGWHISIIKGWTYILHTADMQVLAALSGEGVVISTLATSAALPVRLKSDIWKGLSWSCACPL